MVNWSFHLTDLKAEQIISLLEIIGFEPPSQCNLEDRRRWALSATGTFSTSSLYSVLNQDMDFPPFPYKAIWNTKIPTKISFFLWLASHDRIITADKFIEWGYHHVNKYFLCNNNEKNIKHLFFECPFSRTIWNCLLSSYRINGLWPSNILNMLRVWNSLKYIDADRKIWNLHLQLHFGPSWSKERRKYLKRKLKYWACMLKCKSSSLLLDVVFQT